MPDAPANPAGSLPRNIRPPRRQASRRPRPTFQARRIARSAAWDARSIARAAPPAFPAFQARQAALLPHAPLPPSAVPGMQTDPSAMFRLRSAHRSKSFPQPRLRRIRHRSPEPSCRRRAASETFCIRGPASASVPRQKPDASQATPPKAPVRRTNASARGQKTMKKRGKKPPRKGNSSPRHASKDKMPSARCCRSARPARASTRRLWTRPDSECADCANRGSAAPAIFPPQ